MSVSSLDLMILLALLVVVLGIGYVFRLRIKQSQDFVEASGSAKLAALALAGAGMCAPELLGLGAAGAQWGLAVALLFVMGAVPALLLLGRWLAPWMRTAKARTLPELLGHRFDSKTRELSAVLFVLFAVLSMGLSLRWIANLFAALHLFDRLLRGYGVATGAVIPLGVLLPALAALACVSFGGLMAAFYSRIALFAISFVAMLPVIVIGWRNQAGAAELHAAMAGAGLNLTQGAMALALALLAGAALWCADLRAVQFALISKPKQGCPARTAALLMLPVALVAALPGVLAGALPTPHSQTEVRETNGVIYHQITVVRPEAEAGKGAIPALLDAQNHQSVRDGSGKALLDWKLATPGLIGQLAEGWLGLGLAALLAALLSGLVATLSAMNAVLHADLLHLKPEQEPRRLTVQRLAGLVAVLAAAEVAFTTSSVDPATALPLIFLSANLPLLAVLVLGSAWKRTNGHGAFTGLLAGVAAGVLHHGLTLPAGAVRGWNGGWIAPLCTASSALAQTLGTALLSAGVAILGAILITLFSARRPATSLPGA